MIVPDINLNNCDKCASDNLNIIFGNDPPNIYVFAVCLACGKRGKSSYLTIDSSEKFTCSLIPVINQAGFYWNRGEVE